MRASARQIEALFPGEVARVGQVIGYLLDLKNGVAAKPITALSLLLANQASELAQGSIDLVEEERGAGTGAASRNIPLVQDHDVKSLSGQCISSESARKARAENGNIAPKIVAQPWVMCEPAIAIRPK